MALDFLTVLAVTVIGTCYEFPVQGGIIAGGGLTYYESITDNLFKWCFAFPLAYLSAYVLHFPPVVTFACLYADQIVKSIPNAIVVNRYHWVRKLTK